MLIFEPPEVMKLVEKRSDAGKKAPRRPPATTPEGREIQLQALAYDLAEERLLNKTASAQEIVYLLKSATTREQLELERIRNGNLLDQAKVEQIKSTAGQEQLLREAMRAFTEYRGEEANSEIIEDDY